MKYTIFIFLFYYSLSAQVNEAENLKDFPDTKIILDRFGTQSKTFLRNLKENVSSSNYKFIKNEFEEFEMVFKKEIEVGKYMNKGPCFDFLTNVWLEVTRSNNINRNAYQVLLANNTTPNAYCLPNGVFVFNLGLFYWLKDESEIASVLCHELAHNILDHAVRAQLVQHSENIKNQITKTSIKSARLTSKKAHALYKQLVYSKSSLSRQYELEADSLSIELLKSTKFPTKGAIRALTSLKQYDSIVSNNSLNCIKLLELFNASGVVVDTNLTLNHSNNESYIEGDGVDIDSIQDHPELLARIERLQKFISKQELDKEVKPDSITFKLKNQAESNFARIYFNEEKLGNCMYYCLMNLQKDHLVDRSRNWLFECFSQIRNHKSTYTLSKRLERVDKKIQKYDFALMLYILWNLNLSDIDKICNYLR